MPGNSDYAAEAFINFITGCVPPPAIAGRWLALFTTAPTSDAGTGGTEVSGGAYARVQVAGEVTASTSITSGVTTTITVGTGQTWIVPGMNVYDITAAKQIGTVSTYVSGTGVITLTAVASNSGSGSTDSLDISAWPQASASSGTEPATTPANVTNGAVITFAQATLSWGTVVAWGIYDAVTAGNFLFGDYLGNNKWIPFTCTAANPGVLTTDLSGDVPANSTPCVVTSKFGATLPSGTWSGVLTSAGASGLTFNLGVNSTGTAGGGMFRQITQQSIPANVTASFAAATFTLSQA